MQYVYYSTLTVVFNQYIVLDITTSQIIFIYTTFLLGHMYAHIQKEEPNFTYTNLQLVVFMADE